MALARRVSDQRYAVSRAMPILATHFDASLLAELLERDTEGYLVPAAFAAVGEAALPQLVAAWQKSEGKVREARNAAIVRVVAEGAGPLSEEASRAVETLGLDALDLREGESYWPTERAQAAEALLRRLSAEARDALVLDAAKTSKRPERAYRFVGQLSEDARTKATAALLERASTLTNDDHFDVGVRGLGADAPKVFAAALPEGGSAALLKRLEKALGKDGFTAFLASRGETKKTWLESLRAIAAEAGAGERIYLLEPKWRMDDVTWSAPSGSYSRLGGRGPAGVEVPKRSDGDAFTHVLTIDLDEAPELRARLRTEARAVSLYVPDPRGGEDYEETVLIPLAADAA
ncbi:MAG: hypothetical protein KC586_18685, partial [Myxococcales bacterium]|nr:hypothetical protein [Myxococcales bacterium]